MTRYETIAYDVVDGVAEIVLDRPAVLNAFNELMIDELNQAVYAADADDDVYAIVLTGRGRAFCAGVDTDEVLGPAGERGRLYNEVQLVKTERVFQLLYHGETPTVAAVNGPAVGGGVGFALFCDFRVMSRDAFLRDRHIELGLPAGPEAWILSRLIGESQAKTHILLGEDITPETAEATGLACAVVEPDAVLDAARSIAHLFRDKPSMGLRATTRMLGRSYGSLDAVLRDHREHHWRVLDDPEHRTAVELVRDGEPPVIERDYSP